MITRKQLSERFQAVRKTTEEICHPLITEDYVIQSCEDVSPPKWHLAHTSWFFETFVLSDKPCGYKEFDPHFNYLFNSYYQTIGSPYPRPRRGLLSRPSAETVYAYRRSVDEGVLNLLIRATEEEFVAIAPIIEVGLQHEQQHQELLFMDIKHNLSIQPDLPVYRSLSSSRSVCTGGGSSEPSIAMEGGLTTIGYFGDGFCFDNERPQHQAFINPYAIAPKLVTNGDYLQFIEQGGYSQPQWWLADGWDAIQRFGWQSPLYWSRQNDRWHVFTLSGLKELDPCEPVSHVSYYEADAYARWRGYRLPTEEEWEYFVLRSGLICNEGHFMESGLFHPQACDKAADGVAQQFFGDLWEWTASAYLPYPGYKPLPGSLGEYNGKFMNNQMVLRGGCCVTPRDHIRPTYRNFYQPEKRWSFCGIRLAVTM
ncbi:ergothioneine biosynthesis protein EgtB [Legionella spiritensis]|uniref:Methyltransferase n=1 Tax=Legionella spiritensis TaxID=452 RepID=A0A0W0YXT8_LEGSP|nr:ergothioneine biosynthesis protein EgtB [Legionella spiritensis]KTD61722.1 methyltransferase [Legionella spiritensis]SNV38761.1 methyltransferase [Legionella spiritensis]